jgi:hypothetical protein
MKTYGGSEGAGVFFFNFGTRGKWVISFAPRPCYKRCNKVKVTVHFALEQGTKAQRGSRGIPLLFLNLGARWGWVVNVTSRPGRFTPGIDPVPIVKEAGWASGPVWTGAENLASIGIRSQDCPASIESL